MADKSLRQAMGYALDNDAVGSRFYNGLRTNATTLIPPVFGTLHNTEVEGYTLNIDKANQLLDDAGYKDVDGDGMREDKNGEKLTINFASMSGGETAQPLADYYIQQWNEIGLDIHNTGRLIDFQAFYDKLKMMILKLMFTKVHGELDQILLQLAFMDQTQHSTTLVLNLKKTRSY